MKAKDLRFVVEVEGKKPQLVFSQDETYFVMTLMDDDERGNFFAISEWETEEVLRAVDKLGNELFHPKEVNLFRSKEEAYRQSRIRAICYVLVAQKQMMVEKVGREILFRSWREYGRLSRPQETTKRSTSKRGWATPVPSQEYSYWERKKSLHSPDAKAIPAKGRKSAAAAKNRKYRLCVCGSSVRESRWEKHLAGLCPKSEK